MNTTRRTFLQTTSLLAATLPLTNLRLAGAESSAPTAPAGRGRGLFFDESDLPRIRANTTDPRFAAYWQSLVTADLVDDTDFLENLTVYEGPYIKAVRDDPDEFTRDDFWLYEHLRSTRARQPARS